MARLPRIGPVGIPQHIIQRGNNRQVCFASEQDQAVYIHWLEKYASQFDVSIHAWVLMTNHIHLLATPNIHAGVSSMMQAVGRRYVRYFNREYQRSGTLWEGRFKSCLVQSETYLLVCQRYIELNPVAALDAVDACRYFSGLILGALYGESKEQILSAMYSPVTNYWKCHPLCPAIENVARGSFKHKSREAIKSTGYVVDSLEAALWAFHCTSSFEEGAVYAVNLGGDSDTIGAIYGQLAGAFYGETSIPFRFIKKLYEPHLFYYVADEMCAYYSGKEIIV